MDRNYSPVILVSVVTGLVLVVVGVCVKWAIFPQIVEMMILNQLDLSPGTTAYGAWVGDALSQ